MLLRTSMKGLWMAFEDRRTLISAARSAFMAARFLSGGSAVDSTYFLPTDFRTGISSGVRVPGPIVIWPHGTPLCGIAGTNLTRTLPEVVIQIRRR